MVGARALRINERYSIAGAAGILGLVLVLGLFGCLSLLGANPSKRLSGLGSEEAVVAQEGSDGHTRNNSAGSESAPAPATSEESLTESDPSGERGEPTITPGSAVLAAVAAPGEPRPTAPTPRQQQPAPTKPATAAPTPQATLQPTPEPTLAVTPPPATPTPAPDGCSAGNGTPVIRENGRHVRLEYASVLSYEGDVLLVDVGGTVAVLRITSLTVVTGNASAATLVRAEGHREGDGSVTADLVEVLCPDSARG